MEQARYGFVRAKGDFDKVAVRECVEMDKGGYSPRFLGVNGGVTIVTVLDGGWTGHILAVRDCEVKWTSKDACLGIMALKASY